MAGYQCAQSLYSASWVGGQLCRWILLASSRRLRPTGAVSDRPRRRAERHGQSAFHRHPPDA
jgi:hypothetical protein